jgi:methylmalonyl-CoA mutase N-terminal domain/subunit
MLRFHTQTSGVSLTAQQPENNVVRVAYQALAAVLGGTQSLHTNSRDEALALPTEQAVQIALRTQQILAHETGVADVIDPLGGSYFVEALTDRVEAEARDLLDRVDGIGGMVRAIETGFVPKEIQDAAYRERQAVEAGRRIVVGVNAFGTEEASPIPLFQVDPRVEPDQVGRVRRLRAGRDGVAAERALARLADAARGAENLVPFILEAVKAYATVGEICHRLRGVFGEHQESVVL